MALLKERVEPAPPKWICRCRGGRYSPDDPMGRTWFIQITSECKPHFTQLPIEVRLRILLNEGYRF